MALLFICNLQAQHSVKDPLQQKAIWQSCKEEKNAQKAEKCTQEALKAFFQSKVKYPASAIKNKQSGKVSIKLVFSEKGKLLIHETKITKTPHAILGDEVLRIAQLLPTLEAARLQNGKNVKSTYLIPVDFVLP